MSENKNMRYLAETNALANWIVRWFEAVAICALLGVAEARTGSWLVGILFVVSLLPPLLISFTGIARLIELVAEKIGIDDETEFSGRAVGWIEIGVKTVAMAITFLVLFTVRDLIVADLPND
ncbi:hypothetical protein [Erythrobacter sp. JK5]|uniref:hypothetical protein n=1 Tax=Erythrobacter sp. JK5 TaxID=2829500 RepID=UPI001BABBC28|nr:hypothetical protein [Erythrobacter sp. JK5]QUL37749.1 hypothetical protein KDC96_15650 [Erythrobacter sp. JK5]